MSGLSLAEGSDEEILALYVDDATGSSRREAAFLELVSRYERRVYAIAYRYFGNHADAEDATQETFLSLARKADQFRGGSRLSTWIYRVTVNACNDLGRRYARRPQTLMADMTDISPADGDLSADDRIAASELGHEIQRALMQLDELSRTLIILCAIEGQSYAEVSEALDLPVGTIKSRVFRARAKLAELLEPVRGDAEDGAREGPEPGPAARPPGHDSRAPRGPPADREPPS